MSSISVLYNPFTQNFDFIGLQSTSAFVETLTGNSGGAVSPTSNNIDIVGSGSITVVGNPSTSTLTISGGGSVWSSTALTTVALAAGNGYIFTSSLAVTATLPTSSCPIGSLIGITVTGSGTVTIAQGTGQTQTIGAVTDTSGSGGNFANTSTGDSVTYVCTTAATSSAGAFQAISVIGNWAKT